MLARRVEAEYLLHAVQVGRLRLSSMPTVRSPCTLEWPRIGPMPAPGLPSCHAATTGWRPAAAARAVLVLGRPCRSRSRWHWADVDLRTATDLRLRNAGHLRSDPSPCAITSSRSSRPTVCSARNAWSSTRSPCASRSNITFIMPLIRARSPPMRMCTNSLLISVEPNVAICTTSCGSAKRISALGHRVDRHDRDAAFACLHQVAHHPRRGAGVLANHDGSA